MTQGRGADRYIVRELSGYGIGPKGTTYSNMRLQTDVMVMDTWYCYNVVASYPSRQRGSRDLPERRLQAEAMARRWNEEHRAWLHAGRWGSGRVS